MINSLSAVAAGAVLFAGGASEWVHSESTSSLSSVVSYQAVSPSVYPSSQVNFQRDIESWVGVTCRGNEPRVFFGLTKMPTLVMHDDPLIAKVRFDDEVRQIVVRQPTSAHYLNPVASEQDYLVTKMATAKNVSLELQWSNVGSVEYNYVMEGAETSISKTMSNCMA
ncbi:hypothetical protein RN22_07730 [Grimontia sp. AD028]|uniref:hypothetical protein n=1 Tax=Grimontia sp. AD028 TaxID=1581149 RepID=UPI00061B3C5E|nr:hypothetical protein [Grimontia sp. AD028]KKD61039.1 hypothetical protein RN22_07730 [Grimontia sp. AD028]